MRKACYLILLFCSLNNLYAQTDFEFPKGWVLNLENFQGATTQFNDTPDLYLTELRLTPQYTLIPALLRVGGSAGVVFNNKKFSGLFGASLAFKIKTVNVSNLSSLSILNLQWIVEHLWGTQQQQLIGTGFKMEFAQLLLLSIVGDRDYRLNNWRFQLGLGINFIRKKVPIDPLK
jgi:hypothetical protein